MKGESLQKRFDDKYVPEPMSGCWLWEGAIFERTGYGQMRMNKKIFLAHRIAWELYRGPIPKGEGYHGICVCHKCDNPFCVNPDHLFLGNHLANMQDRNTKGRAPNLKGQNNPFSRLDNTQIIAIRADKRSHTDTALDYGVSRHTIARIRQYKRWNHVPDKEANQ